MAIVTVSINSTPGARENAWYQVVDDLNNNNLGTIENIADRADVIRNHKLSSPGVNMDETISSIVETEINNTLNSEETKGFNDTQKRTIRMKFIHWFKNECSSVLAKINSNETFITSIFYLDTVSKHEWLFFNTLHRLGVNVLVITKDNDNIVFRSKLATIIKYNTNENLSLGKEEHKTKSSDEIKPLTNSLFYKTENITTEMLVDGTFIDMITDSVKNIKCIVSGYDDSVETSVIASKISSKYSENDNVAFFDKKIDKPSIEETSKIYRLNKNDADYIINTTKMFIKCADKVIEHDLKIYFELEMNILKNTGNSAQIIYNKAVNIICWIDRYINNGVTAFVYYGIPEGNETIFLRILANIGGINVIVLSAKQDNSLEKLANSIENKTFIKLNKSKENEVLSLISTNTVTTMAYNASKRVEQTLFDGTLGLYKEGQITSCTTKHMACTFDEIKLWWNKEMYIRPGFNKEGNVADIPVLFGVIRGVSDTPAKYRDLIQMFACGKTLLYINNNFAPSHNNNQGPVIHNLADINGTRFSEQKPIIIGGKVQPDVIKNSRNYKYSFMDITKQDFIISKIQELLDDNRMSIPEQYRNYRGSSNNEYDDMLLGMTLNLDTEVIRHIQWFNFTDYNPNVIVICNNENTLSYKDALYLRFLNKLGFDVLVFVPTQYASIENFIRHTEYEVYNIGRPEYNLDISGISVKPDANYIEKVQEKANKKGFFSKLFS